MPGVALYLQVSKLIASDCRSGALSAAPCLQSKIAQADTTRMSGDTTPMYSKLGDDPEVAAVLEAFVETLAPRLDELQDLEAGSDYETLDRHAAELSVDAIKTGFDLLSDCASSIADAARDRDRDLVYKHLIDLTEMSWRIRLGHRGAA